MNNEQMRLKAMIVKQEDIIRRQTEMKTQFKKVAIQAVATAEEIAAERDKLMKENIELHCDIEELQNRLNFLHRYIGKIKHACGLGCNSPNPRIAEQNTHMLEQLEKYIETYLNNN